MTSAIYAGILGIIFTFLSALTGATRRILNINIGDANNEKLQRLIRAQGNCAEYTPVFLILLAFAEYNGVSVIAIHLLGSVFTLGRISHAYGIIRAEAIMGNTPRGLIYRGVGMLCTLTPILLLSIVLVLL